MPSLSLIVISLVIAATMCFVVVLFLNTATRNRIARLFNPHDDTRTVMSVINRLAVEERQLEGLLSKSLKTICETLGLSSGRFVILDDGKLYKAVHYGSVPIRIPTLAELQKVSLPRLLADDYSGGVRKQILEKYTVSALFSLRAEEQHVGFLMLGPKRAGEAYTTRDLALLEAVSEALTAPIINARTYRKIEVLNAALQQKVDEATNRLRIINHNVRALDTAKDEFISVASHQMRTPLTAIKGGISLVMDGDAGRVTKEQQAYLQQAYASAERLLELVTDLLDASRMSAGRFSLESKPTDLAEVTRDEVRQQRSRAETKGLRLRLELPRRRLPRVLLDEGKTRQVMMNFIDNAIYYTNSGSITVQLERIEEKIRYTVRDTGIGVPPAAQKKLFTKFYRASNAKQTRPDGTGLGLYLAKKVVEDQGGQIVFFSELGHGSSFGFELPLKDTRTRVRSTPVK